MTAFDVVCLPEINDFLDDTTAKDERNIRDRFDRLRENPYPDNDRADIRHIDGDDDSYYVCHVSQSWSIFYYIDEDAQQVQVWDIPTFEKAHKMYDRL